MCVDTIDIWSILVWNVVDFLLRQYLHTPVNFWHWHSGTDTINGQNVIILLFYRLHSILRMMIAQCLCTEQTLFTIHIFYLFYFIVFIHGISIFIPFFFLIYGNMVWILTMSIFIYDLIKPVFWYLMSINLISSKS